MLWLSYLIIVIPFGSFLYVDFKKHLSNVSSLSLVLFLVITPPETLNSRSEGTEVGEIYLMALYNSFKFGERFSALSKYLKSSAKL